MRKSFKYSLRSQKKVFRNICAIVITIFTFAFVPFARALEITPTSVTAAPGEIIRLKITGTSASQRFFPPHSNDSTVVRFDTDGTPRALSPGRAVLSFRSGDDYATVAVTVRAKSAPTAPSALSPATDAANTHPIDAIVNQNLHDLGLTPSALCTNAEYLRRVCLDLMGSLPPAGIAEKFLSADSAPSPEKRAQLIDWIFTQPEYADYWAMKWCDVLRVKSEFPSNLWPNAVQTYHAWIRAAMASNKPYDKFAHELLLTAGSNFREPPSNFYRATPKRDADGLGSAFALIFMGARLDCSVCKEHPYQTWTHEQAAGIAAFFTNVRYKKTDEWKEEIVFFAPTWPAYKSQSGATVAPALPGGTATPAYNRQANPQKLIADWITSPGNPYFARHVANRYWCALFGRGITMPVDDVRPGNPPSNPELLNLLAQKLIESRYDLRALLRFIVTSKTYQRSSLANDTNRADSQNFSHYIPRRLDAEVLADAIGRATGVFESFTSRIPEPFAMWPDDFHSVQNPDASVTSGFLETFGRPGRDTSYEVERDRKPSMAQALYLLDSEEFSKKLAKKDGVISELVKEYGRDRAALATECYLRLLARKPTDAELTRVLAHYKKTSDTAKATQDLVWALLNTKEFLYNH